jgi:hypothetical protein
MRWRRIYTSASKHVSTGEPLSALSSLVAPDVPLVAPVAVGGRAAVLRY